MKDAYYFSHDSNAKDDPKSMILIDQLGLEGYGIFWILIETLRDQPDYKYPLNLVPILARRYNTTAEKMMLVVSKYGYFEFEGDEFFYSISLNKRMEHLAEVREKRSKAGKVSAEKRKQMLSINSTSVDQMLNKGKDSKVNQSKLKESIVKYFIENSFSENYALEFFEYYSGLGWNDKNGKQIKNWKLKAQSVWFKDEKKVKPKVKKYAVDCGDRILYMTKELFESKGMAKGGYKIDLKNYKYE